MLTDSRDAMSLAGVQIVWAMNPAGEILEDSSPWRAFTGQRFDQMSGRGWTDAVHPDDRDRLPARNRAAYETQYRLRRYDGEYRQMAVRAVPILDAERNLREWVVSGVDITERRRAEDEAAARLEAAHRELDNFTYSVSHDLRAPLRAIHGFSRILCEEHASQLSAPARHCLDVVRNNALQMSDMLDGLLEISRLGRQPLSRQLLSPVDLVTEALDTLHARSGGRLEIVIGELPPCEGDPLLLKQVFVRLLSNAIKYSSHREPARIEVCACVSKSGGPPAYCVRDNGAGFDMRYATKLFGVFQRLHRASDYPGVGIGLAIVQQIVYRHGGRVWAEAEADRGAAFYFTLEPDA